MNNTLSELTVKQLRKAIKIKARLETLQARLDEILENDGGEIPVPFFKGPKKGGRKMSAAGRAAISAAAKARWKAAKAAGKNRL